MHRSLIGVTVAVALLLGGCGSPSDDPKTPSATQSVSTPPIQPPTPEPTPPFSPATPPAPPEVTCEVTEASAETEYGELVSGDSAELDVELTAWSVGDVLNEFEIVLTAHDQDAPSIRLVLHVLLESGYIVLEVQLIWSDGEREELFVDYLSASTDRIEGQAQNIDIIFVGEDRSMQLTVVC